MKQSLWAIAAAACFSIMGAFVKFCTEDLGSFELVFYRSLFGAIFIAFVVAGSGGTLFIDGLRICQNVPAVFTERRNRRHHVFLRTEHGSRRVGIDLFRVTAAEDPDPSRSEQNAACKQAKLCCNTHIDFLQFS